MPYFSSSPATFLKLVSSIVPVEIAALLLAVGGLGAISPAASAQTSPPNVPVRIDSGAVRVNNNAREIRTGPLRNGSGIPLPTSLPANTSNRVPVNVDRTRQAPNSIEIRSDSSYIEESFNTIVNGQTGGNERYDLQRDSLSITTTFEINSVLTEHAFGEGIQVTVISRDGTRSAPQTAFVRGNRVTQGPGGVALGLNEQISVTYGADDVVELRVLNIRRNGAQPSESAIYFTQNFTENGQVGEFVVEDFEGGGDLDFADGEYVQAPTGTGSAIALQETPAQSTTNVPVTVPLPDFIDSATTINEAVADVGERTIVEDVEIGRDRGQVEINSQNPLSLLGHASGTRTEAGEQLIYNQYSGAFEARLGSDGLGATAQLRPLINNPGAPPTLLTGNLRFDPFANNNEAGLTTTVGVTQYLTRTHRFATDVFGNSVVRPDGEEAPLLVPTGLFNNRRIVGYVPTVSSVMQGTPLSSTGGVFALPADREIEISPPNPQRVGRGSSAYTDNVGGLLIERADGVITFIPQWTKAGYAQSSISLGVGEATRIIYALVPQQPGQNIQLGQTYTATRASGEYTLSDGGFRVISADLQPQNFVAETAEVYAVEDTVATANAPTDRFNGVQGLYVEVPSGDLVSTVDAADAAEADARVGSALIPISRVEEAGQPGYVRTTRAGGLYLGGALTGGLGNQEDTVLLSRTTTRNAVEERRRQQIVETFATPRSRIDNIRTDTGTITQNRGRADFDINEAGLLTNVRFTRDPNVATVIVNPGGGSRVTREVGDVILGDRTQTGTVTGDETVSQSLRPLEINQASVSEKDSYANLAAVQGELTLGGVYNFGNTPWTTAANTLRTELFLRDSVFGRSDSGSDTGIRAEAVFHPFGEVQRDAYQLDTAGNVLPVYQTEPVFDEQGAPVMDMLTDENGVSVEVARHQFVLDEAGDRIIEQVGTGKAKGPGAYVRVENTFDDGDVEVAGGLQLTF